MHPPQIKSVIIIGAGTAGLTAAHFIGSAGLKVTILEQESRVGESWRRRHPQLSLNTHRHLSASDVIVATGRDKRPYTPRWTGTDSFRGSLIHATDFGLAKDYEAKRVLVVGAGNSGFDILNHLAKVKTRQVWLSARGGPSLLPKRFAGLAVHRLSPLMSHLPAWVSDKVISITQWLAFGDLTKFGLPAAPRGGATRLAKDHVALAADDGAVKALKTGRITIVPELQEFTSDGVVLADGSTISPDIVIAATGYITDLEKMIGNLGILGNRGIPSVNGGQRLSQAPGLWFIGMRANITGDVYSAAQQAREIARAIQKARH